MTADDPVAVGLVANLNRPGGNVTGVSFVSAILGAKRLELLRALAPKADMIGMLVEPYSTESQNQSRDVQEAARALMSCSMARSSTPSEKPDRHRKLAAPLQYDQAACLARLQATNTRGVPARLRRVAGCATPIGSAGHAGATANLKLTFHLDHSPGADHGSCPSSRGVAPRFL
jgi:ABC transporter substrate binding protein